MAIKLNSCLAMCFRLFKSDFNLDVKDDFPSIPSCLYLGQLCEFVIGHFLKGEGNLKKEWADRSTEVTAVEVKKFKRQNTLSF